MGLEINTVVTLENNLKYLVLNETMFQGKKYFLTNEVNENKEVVSEEAIFFEEELEGLDTYVKRVLDEDLIQQLMSSMEM